MLSGSSPAVCRLSRSMQALCTYSRGSSDCSHSVRILALQSATSPRKSNLEFLDGQAGRQTNRACWSGRRRFISISGVMTVSTVLFNPVQHAKSETTAAAAPQRLKLTKSANWPHLCLCRPFYRSRVCVRSESPHRFSQAVVQSCCYQFQSSNLTLPGCVSVCLSSCL